MKKLRNKETGEIGNKIIDYITNTILVVSTKNGDTICGNTVVASYDNEEDLYQEWEEIEKDDCKVITFQDGCFRVGDDYENEAGIYLSGWRIIGNIHENPELLEEEE